MAKKSLILEKRAQIYFPYSDFLNMEAPAQTS